MLLVLGITGELAHAAQRTHRYFRFVPTKVRDNPALANSIQLSEFEFRLRGNRVNMSGVTVTNPGGNSPAAETPAKVIDSDTSTKWLDFNRRELVFTFPNPVTIDSYNFATANDSSERDPYSWRLEGSDDGSTWTLLDEIIGYSATTTRLTWQAGFTLPATVQPTASFWHPSVLLNWSPAADTNSDFNRASVPLKSRFLDPALNVNANARPNEGGVAFISTFAPTSNNPSQGSPVEKYNAVTMWQYIDTLIFWGGSAGEGLILAPNPTVIDAAHRNGVPVLGTVFFPPTAYGGQIAWVNDFLQKNGSTFPVADKLIQVAQHYGFDGWFINQETAGGNSTTAANMRDFVSYIRANSNLQIMWYDAMTESGSVSWQGALNSSNDWFMSYNAAPVSHSMFLDFRWTSTSISSSRTTAQTLGVSPYKLYTGVDIESGGGYNATPDWETIFPSGQPHRTSIGFYGGQWVFTSSSDPADFHTREIRFWSGANANPANTTTTSSWKGLANYIPARSAITTKPFVTNFNRGQGNRYLIDGQLLKSGPWNNMSLQDVLPTWRWIVESTGTKLSPTLDLSDAYYGGTSLRFTGSLDGTNDVKLFQTRLPVAADTKLQIVYKRGAAGSPSAAQVALSFTDNPTSFVYLPVGNTTTSAWNKVELSLGAYAGKTIAVIGLRLSNATTITGYDLRVGRIAVYDGAISTPAAPTGLVVSRQDSADVDTLSLRLKWTASSSPVSHYNVYQRNPDNTLVWLGATPNNAYYLPAVRRKALETVLKIEVQAVGLDFGSSASATVTATIPPGPNTRFAIPVGTSAGTATVIGTTGAYNNGTVNTREKVFDGNTSTYFDAPTADGAWAGLDLGSGYERTITAVRFFPRSGNGTRMIGGRFQGSNSADFSNAVTLATVMNPPVEGVYTTMAISAGGSFRYLRYLSPNGAYCNVAEVQFYGVPLPSAPVNLSGKLVDGTASLSWNGSTYANTYTLKRATNSGGPFVTVKSDITGTSYVDSGLNVNGSYFYVVSATNEAGEGTNSAQINVADGYVQWLSQQGRTSGSPGSAFNADADGDSVPNGVEYAAPGGVNVSGNGPASTVSAEIRDDSAITVTLLRSTDLMNWTPVPFAVANDQTGVSSGFKRWTAQDPNTTGDQKRFYRLELRR